jgi:hypothetical protein
VSHTSKQSGVLYLDWDVPDVLVPFLPPGVVGTLLIKVEAGFIDEDDLALA